MSTRFDGFLKHIPGILLGHIALSAINRPLSQRRPSGLAGTRTGVCGAFISSSHKKVPRDIFCFSFINIIISLALRQCAARSSTWITHNGARSSTWITHNGPERRIVGVSCFVFDGGWAHRTENSSAENSKNEPRETSARKKNKEKKNGSSPSCPVRCLSITLSFSWLA